MNSLKNHILAHREAYICCLLCIVTYLVYMQVTKHPFINYDDHLYVTGNKHVLNGLTIENISWAFSKSSTSSTGNWHPLTLISHMIDVELFVIKAGMHHLTSLCFHIINTLLLFIIFRKMTGDFWKSIFVAALFALHPLHVESVAWVAERKDVLSTFFWMLALLSYVWYVEHPGMGRYGTIFLFFVLGLLSKPMVVTLPFVLLLLDYWPMRRIRKFAVDEGGAGLNADKPVISLIIEKIPLFVGAAIISVVTYVTQQQHGSMKSLEHFPLITRIANAVVSYTAYVGKMVLPFDLAVFYPHPREIEPSILCGSALILLLISFFSFRHARRQPFYIVGWLWYLGTLVPVIGLIQVGGQAMADRYTYIPLIGLFIMISWGGHDLFSGSRYRMKIIAVAATLVIITLSCLTWKQVGLWKSSMILFSHTLEVTHDNYIAHNNLGQIHEAKNDYRNAIQHCVEAVRIAPDNLKIRSNFGVVLMKSGRIEDAISQFEVILQKDPNNKCTLVNLGTAYLQLGNFKEANECFHKALRLYGDSADAYFGLGCVLSRQGRNNDAVEQYLRALEINPRHINARVNLANALVRISRIDDAIKHYGEVLKIEPHHATAKHNFQVLVSQRQELDEKIKSLQSAVDQNPENSTLLYHLGVAHQKRGHSEKALTYYKLALLYNNELIEANQNMFLIYSEREDYEDARSILFRMIEHQPNNTDIHYNIACTYALNKNVEASIEWLEKAVVMGFNDWNLIKADPDLDAIKRTSAYQTLLETH